jgi:hypothetical protein
MNAAADYAVATSLLTRPLPAYVSYVDHTSGGWGPFQGAHQATVVVDVRRGRIISGKPTAIHIATGNDSTGTWGDEDAVTHPAFRPRCYDATAAQAATYDGRPAERIALAGHCGDDHDKKDEDFSALYVDPSTHVPIAAVGHDEDDHVDVTLEEHFTQVADHVVPAALRVKVLGSGWMAWLDVTARVEYTDYRFSDQPF